MQDLKKIYVDCRLDLDDVIKISNLLHFLGANGPSLKTTLGFRTLKNKWNLARLTPMNNIQT